MDRYIHDALLNFADWYVFQRPDWLGKERDCVNIFANQYLTAGIGLGAAIWHAGQIRVECGVKQPSDKTRYPRPSASKDLVIWDDPLRTTWDENWHPSHTPRAIIEWKNYRSAAAPQGFHTHDVDWLVAFTTDNPKSFGFLVSTHAPQALRSCKWVMVRGGKIGKIHKVTL